MKTRFLLAAVAALMGAAPASHADVLSLYGSVHGGGAGGTGLSGKQKDDAFHDGASGGAYGALVGVELLFVDGWIEHTQYRASDGLVGTWTQFMVGFDAAFPLGSPSKGGKVNDAGKRTGGYSPAFVELGLGFGFGVGTGQQIDPPLDYTEVTDRGFLLQASALIGYRFNRAISFGLRVPVQWGYMFKKGVANDTDNHYQSLQAAALLNLQLKFQLK